MPATMIRGIALVLAVCFVALLTAPALAAPSARGPGGYTVPQRFSLSGGFAAARGPHLLTFLQLMAFPVAGPLAALFWGERAVHRVIFPASGARPVAVAHTFSNVPVSRIMNRSSFPAAPGFRGMGGIGGIGAAENLTTYIGGRGYDVAAMQAALSQARTALAASNTTAYRVAMVTYRKDLNAKVIAGTIPSSVIADYLKTLPATNTMPAWRGSPGMRGFLPSRWSGNGTGWGSPQPAA